MEYTPPLQDYWTDYTLDECGAVKEFLDELRLLYDLLGDSIGRRFRTVMDSVTFTRGLIEIQLTYDLSDHVEIEIRREDVVDKSKRAAMLERLYGRHVAQSL